MDLFRESGMKMFAFTTKHHEGFSMFDTKTRVRQRANWIAPGGPALEGCDLAYSIMESPFRRDVVKGLCDAAQKRGIKIDLYFSHLDWYDAYFRPYVYHPLQVPSSLQLTSAREMDEAKNAGRSLGYRARSHTGTGREHDRTPSRATGRVAHELRHHRHGLLGHVARPLALAGAAQDHPAAS
jgi:hypothetical protein